VLLLMDFFVAAIKLIIHTSFSRCTQNALYLCHSTPKIKHHPPLSFMAMEPHLQMDSKLVNT
jgi:hypothetical protein